MDTLLYFSKKRKPIVFLQLHTGKRISDFERPKPRNGVQTDVLISKTTQEDDKRN